MSEPTRTVFTISGRVEAPELRAVLDRVLRVFRTDPRSTVHVNCAGVVSLTGDALLMLAWACQQCKVAGVTLRLVEFPGQIMATAGERLAEAVTRHTASSRTRWDAAYSCN